MINDADRHDQIEALRTLKTLLDDDNGDVHDIRDAAIRAVNRFDSSIAAHGRWKPYSRRGSSDPEIRAEADRLGRAGVECHPQYRGRLRRRIASAFAEIAITETPESDRHSRPGDARGEAPRDPRSNADVADQYPRQSTHGPTWRRPPAASRTRR